MCLISDACVENFKPINCRIESGAENGNSLRNVMKQDATGDNLLLVGVIVRSARMVFGELSGTPIMGYN